MAETRYYEDWISTLSGLLTYGELITDIGDWEVEQAEGNLNKLLQTKLEFKEHRHLQVKFTAMMPWMHEGSEVWKITTVPIMKTNKQATILLESDY